MARRKMSDKSGKMSMDEMRKLINKHAGMTVAYDMREENPSDVSAWIPTGSRWLDSIICRGKIAGIPVGRIAELAGLESSGKSYMAVQMAVNAQKMGMDVLYFDSESAMSSEFLESAGVDLSRFIYLQAISLEFVLETIESILANSNTPTFFVLDSLANTPTDAETEDGNYNPKSDIAPLARVASKGMKKLVVPLANHGSTLLILNQLRTIVGAHPMAKAPEQLYFTPGGKAVTYSYSLRIWLIRYNGKDHRVEDENGFRVGSSMKAKLLKNRFGCEGRECHMRINWGGDGVYVHDKEMWFDAIKSSQHLKTGAWNTLALADGTEIKFQKSSWMEKLEEPNFCSRVTELLDEELIHKFARREGNAESYYNLDEENAEE